MMIKKYEKFNKNSNKGDRNRYNHKKLIDILFLMGWRMYKHKNLLEIVIIKNIDFILLN